MGCFVRGGKKWHGMFCPGMFCPAPGPAIAGPPTTALLQCNLYIFPIFSTRLQVL